MLTPSIVVSSALLLLLLRYLRDPDFQYVRQEFRAHLNVQPEQQREFLLQWSEYEAHLTSEAVSNLVSSF